MGKGGRCVVRAFLITAAGLWVGAQGAAGATAARPPRIDSSTDRAPVGGTLEIRGDGLGGGGDVRVLFFAGKDREPLAEAPIESSRRRLLARVPRGALRGPLRVRTPGGEAVGPAPFTPEYVLHVPPDAFSQPEGLGRLKLGATRVVLADGENRSQLLVSPAMAALGFRDLAFSFPPYEAVYDLGLGTVSVRARLPGADAADPAGTLASTGFDLRVAGASIVVTIGFESEGREFVGEFATVNPFTGPIPWTPFLDVQADGLTVTAVVPLAAAGLRVGPGEVAADVRFAFAVAPTGAAPVNVDATGLKAHIAASVRDGLKAFLNAPGFKDPLAAALSLFFLNNPAAEGIPVSRLELRAAPDGGLDVLALTAYDP